MNDISPNPALLPFVVAVTGHRDLRPQDVELLRAEVRRVLEGMRLRMPNTPVVVLSGLAEGADQLVAEVAVEHGMFLVAVLPMPLAVYRKQMSEEGQQKLDTLLEKAALPILLPVEGRSDAELMSDEEARSHCYETLARFLAKHAQAAIALWDGVDTEKRGGTASVVRYVRSGTAKESADEVESRCGMVYHVVTPRAGNEEKPPEIVTVKLGYEPRYAASVLEAAEGLGHVAFAQVESNFEGFNRESLRQGGGEKSQLLGDVAIPLSPFQRRLATLYERADAISVKANRQRKNFLFWIVVTAGAGALFYGVHGEIFVDQVWLWFTYPAFVLTAMLLHWLSQQERVEERYLDARSLAEALRVQFFWSMGGLQEPVDRYYLVHRRTELDWIRFALKNIWLLHQGAGEQAGAVVNRELVLESWIKDQARWYHRKGWEQAERVRLREKVSRYGLAAAVGWSVLVPLSLLVEKRWGHAHMTEWEYGVSHILLAVPALVAAAFRLWIEQAGYAEQSREYQFMERQFAVKARALEAEISSPAEAEKLLLELGVEALKENARWLLLHRERPLEAMSTL